MNNHAKESDVSDADLFDIELAWESEWKDMPEFIQTKQQEYAKIIVRFNSEQDLVEFSKLINQKITRKTKSIWYPFKSHWGQGSGAKWVSEQTDIQSI